MVAALLHLDEAAHAPLETLHQMRRGLAHRHDVVGDEAGRSAAIALGAELRQIAQHLVHLGHGGVAGGIDLRRAAGDDDAGLRPLAARAADRLARLALRLRGHRAGVDDDGVGEAGARGLATDHLGFHRR